MSNQLNKSEPSICIPKTDGNISRRYVYNIFKKANFGIIDRVDWRAKISGTNNWITIPQDYNSNKYNFEQCQFFIHFKEWNINNSKINNIRLNLLNILNKKKYDIINYPKLMYNNPWYWILSPSRIAKPKY